MYYNEMDGLEFIGEIEWNNYSWEFDLTGVWKTKRGEYWIGDDSGCSCPSPFENFRGIEDLDGPYNKADLRKRLEWKVTNSEYGHGRSEAELRKDISDLLDRIK